MPKPINPQDHTIEEGVWNWEPELMWREAKIANAAYNLGREEALREVDEAIDTLPKAGGHDYPLFDLDRALAIIERLKLQEDRGSTYLADLDNLAMCLKLAANQMDGTDADWQPIETAPKDNTPVLVWQAPWEFPSRATFTTDDEVWCSAGGIEVNPTHWMPLPPTPDAGGE